MNIEELLTRLFNLEYKWKGSNDNYTSKVISNDNREAVSDAVKGWASYQDVNRVLLEKDKEKTELMNKLGELEAKVFTYEAIISNSNFAAIIKKSE